MKITLLSSILWGGDHREAGDVLDLAEIDAQSLIARGRAKVYTEPQQIDTNRALGVNKSTNSTLTKRSYKKKPKAE